MASEIRDCHEVSSYAVKGRLVARHGWLTWWLALAIVVVLSAPAFTETTEDTKHPDPLDPFQRAVVDSLKFPERTTPQ